MLRADREFHHSLLSTFYGIANGRPSTFHVCCRAKGYLGLHKCLLRQHLLVHIRFLLCSDEDGSSNGQRIVQTSNPRTNHRSVEKMSGVLVTIEQEQSEMAQRNCCFRRITAYAMIGIYLLSFYFVCFRNGNRSIDNVS